MSRYVKHAVWFLPVFGLVVSACQGIPPRTPVLDQPEPSRAASTELAPVEYETAEAPDPASSAPGEENAPPAAAPTVDGEIVLLPHLPQGPPVGLPDTGQPLQTGDTPCLLAQVEPDAPSAAPGPLYPGEAFVQVWRLRNLGTCTWLDSFTVQYAAGDPMSGMDGRLLGHALPGETVEVALSLRAPQEPGRHAGGWRLVNDNDEAFGTGPDGQGLLPVLIEVSQEAPRVAFDLFKNACGARWESSEGELSCTAGWSASLVRGDEVDLEDGLKAGETLFVQTPGRRDTWVKAVFPAYQLLPGDRFRASVGCAADRPDCDVVFQLQAILSNGMERKLGVWREQADGSLTEILLDLSSLNNQVVRFVLIVWSNGGGEDDAGVWVRPRIGP